MVYWEVMETFKIMKPCHMLSRQTLTGFIGDVYFA